MDELRRSRWKEVSLGALISGADFAPTDAIDTTMSAEDMHQQRTMLEAMKQVIDSGLTEKQRTALLAELKGMPQDEIARHLGSNRNAVYKLTHDARKRLRSGLEAAGYSADDLSSTTN